MSDLVPGIYPKFSSVEELRALQLTCLRRHLDYLADHSPYYREQFRELGLAPAQLQSIDDLARFPLTGKNEVAEHNLEFLSVAETEVVDVCLTSGTTGQPLALHQTDADLERLAYNEAQAFQQAGITASDRVLVATALDRCFMAGLAYFMGVRQLGATAIRAGAVSPQLLAELICRQRPTAIVGVPSLLAKTATELQLRQLKPAALGVRRLVCIGEPIRQRDWSLNPLGARLREAWQAELFSTYASTEIAAACCECAAGRGGHIPPQLALVEIVAADGTPLAAGETGEVVVTPLGVTGMPLLRYRTGDISFLETDPCSCGRITPRLGPILGRQEQMLKIKGTTLFPLAIFTVLQELPEVTGSYLEVFREHDLSDRVKVTVGVTPGAPDATAISERIAARTRVRVEVAIVSPEQVLQAIIQPDKRKPVTFFDRRNQ